MSCSGPVSIGAVEYLGCIFMTVLIHFLTGISTTKFATFVPHLFMFEYCIDKH